jgi:hypothetical protein
MRKNYFNFIQCSLAGLLLFAIHAYAQSAWLKKLPSGGCCPGCGSPDDPLGPRYRGEPIGGTISTNASAPMPISLPKTDSSATGSNASAPTASSPGTKPANTLPEFINFDGEKYLTVSFARLASFAIKAGPDVVGATPDSMSAEMQLREQLPANIKSLSEKSVAVTGFMLPVSTKDGLTTDFLLLRSQSACCYGVMPKINEWVIVRTTGKGVKAIMDTPVTVLGTFHVGASSENANLTSIYQLDCDKLINPTK